MTLPIALIAAVSELVPGLVRFFKGDRAGDVADKVIDVAKAVSGQDDAASAIAAVKADPALLLQLQAQANQILAQELSAETDQLRSINETIRAEYASTDKFKSSWRPLFGYAVTFTWVVQTLAIIAGMVYAIFVKPEKAGEIIKALGDLIGAMTIMWGIALSVLGVAVSARSKDKQAALGFEPAAGLLTFLTRR